jgi:agmatine/peptidylarginine deiminase
MRYFTLVLFSFVLTATNAQVDLPVGFTSSELEQIARGDFQISSSQTRGIATPPPFTNLRSMAEWEEIQCLTVAWISYPSILKQIVANAKTQTLVIILSENVTATENYLNATNTGGPAFTDMNNVVIVPANFDSVWMRDYAANPVYGNEVDTLMLVDWIYNRPTRPNDDASPQTIADYLGLNLYTMTEAPDDLVNTGGNWMVDGFGTAFASELILEENQSGNPYGVTAKSEADIDLLVEEYLGIDRYIKMPTLPYDGIHHIDMHMKLLDEQRLLIGEYPAGVADGPQINANMEYVVSNFMNKWGEPYEVIRIPMPPSAGGNWPSSNPPSSYRTYTNAVFVNDMVILPIYREEYDTTALRIWQESLPGYQIIGIDCDNQTDNIIAASGAIHCITHSVGVNDPLLISHNPLDDTTNTTTPYEVVAYMNHRSGVVAGRLYWKTDLLGSYNVVDMVSIGNNEWSGLIPAQAAGTTVYYYVEGESNSGKILQRPIAAPAAYWSFDVLGPDAVQEEAFTFSRIFPNPASAITCVEFESFATQRATAFVVNAQGQRVEQVFESTISPGKNKFFIHANKYAAGMYYIQLVGEKGVYHLPFVVE